MPADRLSALVPPAALVLVLVLAGCREPPLPEHDKRPEPQAAAAPASSAAPAPAPAPGALREAMQAPIDQARAAKDATQAAEAQRDEALEAATGD